MTNRYHTKNKAKIRALLLLKNISVKQLAEELKVTSSAVSRVISGDLLSYRIRQYIADCLETRPENLWGQHREE